jgi:hypothetical protein
MKYLTLALFALTIFAGPAMAAVEVGKPAPAVSGTNVLDGKPFSLADAKGKIIVLEWTNHECPFVVKHYGTNNMQAAQKTAAEKGVVWVSIVSSAPGRQGHVTADEAKKIVADAGATPAVKILDESGEIGRAYGADTTPDMIVIDTNGNVAYQGAIDDKSGPSPDTVKGAKNYVLAAIDDLTSGKPVTTPFTQSYGCSVKYGE